MAKNQDPDKGCRQKWAGNRVRNSPFRNTQADIVPDGVEAAEKMIGISYAALAAAGLALDAPLNGDPVGDAAMAQRISIPMGADEIAGRLINRRFAPVNHQP